MVLSVLKRVFLCQRTTCPLRQLSTHGRMATWLLEYTYVANILALRGPYREQHLANANALVNAGVIVAGGPLNNPPDGAIFLFKNTTRENVQSFVDNDPYMRNNLVPNYKISEWSVVVGAIHDATSKL